MYIEDLIQSMISKGEITQEEVDNKINEYAQKTKDDPQGIHKNVSLIEEQSKINIAQAEQERLIKARIDNGEITSATFPDLSAEEQVLTKLVLFKQYSPDQGAVPKSLSGLEFMLVALVKLLDKTMDRTNLTVEESDLFDSLVNVINQNAMPINDTTHWMFQYMDAEFSKVQTNREAYFTEKFNVTGTV